MLAITDHSDQRLALAGERFGRAKPDRLEFIRLEFERAQRDLSREAFCDSLGHVLAEPFPDESVESLTASPDLEHSISGNYVRGLLRRGSSYFAVLAVPDGESADTIEGSLTLALLWLDRTRQSNRRGSDSPFFLACEIPCSASLRHSRITFTSPQEISLNFSATIRHTPQASLIDVRGHLTFFEVGVLGENVARLLGEGHKHIVLNLSGLKYLDSSGIGELARIYVMVLKGGGEMRVVGLSRNVEKVLKVTHLYQVFPEFPDEQAALQSFLGAGPDKSAGNT